MRAWGLVSKTTGEIAGVWAMAWKTREGARLVKGILDESGKDLKVVRLKLWIDDRT